VVKTNSSNFYDTVRKLSRRTGPPGTVSSLQNVVHYQSKATQFMSNSMLETMEKMKAAIRANRRLEVNSTHEILDLMEDMETQVERHTKAVLISKVILSECQVTVK